MASNVMMIKKLQTALNMQGQNILYNSSQFYSREFNKPITVYSIKKAVFDESTGKSTNIELFKTSSQIQVVLFMRDLLFQVQGKEIPTNNEVWTQMKAQYEDKKERKKIKDAST